MRSRTGMIAGASDHRLFFRSWEPAAAPRAQVLLVHGMGEHAGRYDHVGRFLAGCGLAVHTLDQQGHGRSGGTTGWIEDFDHFLDDLAIFHRKLLSEAPDLPLVMLAHSMGGLIGVAYVLDRDPDPDLLVLSGPAIVPVVEPGGRTIDATKLSRDPEQQKAYLEDPLVLRERVTEDLLARLGDGIGKIVGRSGELSMPVLLLHGEDDRVCSYEGAKMFLEMPGTLDVEICSYEGGRHEMFNETNRDEVLADLWRWLDARLTELGRK